MLCQVIICKIFYINVYLSSNIHYTLRIILLGPDLVVTSDGTKQSYSEFFNSDAGGVLGPTLSKYWFSGDDDPQEIVIDEVVGQLIPLIAIPIYGTLFPLPHVYYCFAAFLFFRLFDVWKPYPVSYVDINVKGALGIMLDLSLIHI